MAETASGMLNCVGLQNKGVDYFCEHIYPEVRKLDTAVLVNVSGHSVETYAECARRTAELDDIPAIELNISCPNVKQGGMTFGTDPKAAAEVVSAVRKAYNKHLMPRCLALSEGKAHWSKGEPESQLFVEDRFAMSGLPAKEFRVVRWETPKTDKQGRFRLERVHVYSTSPELACTEVIVGIGVYAGAAFLTKNENLQALINLIKEKKRS